MDRLITTVPGMETHFRWRDLPSYCRATDVKDPFIKLIVKQMRKSGQANALILNTAEEHDGPILYHIRTQCPNPDKHVEGATYRAILSQIRTKCPNVYAIGPINAQLSTRLNAKYGEPHDHFLNTLWEEDRSYISWLDKQPNRSVVYARDLVWTC
ncbi:putative UDP-Glycosyltransferase superfamily protein [Hibiscus syriacus]|uniref:UDP-Glycosyltransferase superfamily protein n=1 Tax=Hibiscus syriacus TaxID=106335 RepID=A0A6A2Y6K0_HIBSY|nr:putative UDP-Glycosyltransferase superfamily protein [Hibiscus syriacus]